jgi:hypothetical protein
LPAIAGGVEKASDVLLRAFLSDDQEKPALVVMG